MNRMAVLVTDRICPATLRHLEKLRVCLGEGAAVTLACVSGVSTSLPIPPIPEPATDILEGCVQYIVERILSHKNFGDRAPFILGLKQAAILPALAIRRLVGLDSWPGYLESCDKRLTRRLLSKGPSDLAISYSQAIPGKIGSAKDFFSSDRYVVKPAFGINSGDVRIFSTWSDAKNYAESPENARQWVPPHVMQALDRYPGDSNARLIEPYIDGTEFSIDGWVKDGVFKAIVQHKLFMVQRSFIGDGLTVSPPIQSAPLPDGWLRLNTPEEKIFEFGHRALRAIGFSEGVFHIEARERQADNTLVLIEVNPRAPGGALWRSAFLRTGYDLELVNIAIQLGMSVPESIVERRKNVLHYPFYAASPGVLTDWGDLNKPMLPPLQGVSIDFVASIGDIFRKKDMLEEPDLAFAVAYDESFEGLLTKFRAILNLRLPRIQELP
jgi:ATP-grasp domain